MREGDKDPMSRAFDPHLRVEIGPGVVMRPIGLADVEPVYAVVDAERTRLSEWLAWPPMLCSPADEAAYVRGAVEGATRGDALSCVVVAGRQVAGGCGLVKVDWMNRSTELGYWLSEAFVGRGIATAAARALVTLTFSDLSFHRVVIRAAVDNHASRAVAERLGFQQEGIERGAELLGTGFVDLATYSMLQPDWAGEPDR